MNECFKISQLILKYFAWLIWENKFVLRISFPRDNKKMFLRFIQWVVFHSLSYSLVAHHCFSNLFQQWMRFTENTSFTIAFIPRQVMWVKLDLTDIHMYVVCQIFSSFLELYSVLRCLVNKNACELSRNC